MTVEARLHPGFELSCRFGFSLQVAVAILLLSVNVSSANAQESPSAELAPGQDSKAEASAPTEPPQVAETPSESPSQSAAEEKAKPEKEEEILFKNLPYTVKVSVAIEGHFLADQAERAEVVNSIREAISRMYGRMWVADVEENDWLVPVNKRRLEWLENEDLLDRYPETEFQKAFLVTVESAGSSFVISCREYDSRIQELTPVSSRTTQDVRSIASITTGLLRDSFRPCVLYQRSFNDETGRRFMEMQVQAGEIPPPDPSAEQVIENDVLRPFVRQMNRREPNKLDRLLRLDLSYVRVMGVDRETSPGLVKGFFITHSPYSPFGGKGRAIQHLAVRQRPAADQSKVRLVLQGRPDKPLVSHRIALAYQLHYKDEEDGPQTKLVSDRNGEVVIDIKPDHPTFWIRVYSGASLLARVPYAPGLIPSDTIELPDDSIRLGVEGEIQLLADELVDAIALRAVLLARARKSAEAGDVEQLESLFARYDQVPAKDYFLEKVNNVRIPAVREANERRLSTARIRQLCDGLQSTVTNFFSDQKRSERMIEIQQLKALAEAKSKAAGN